MDLRIKFDSVTVALACIAVLLVLGGVEAGWPMATSVVVFSASVLGVTAIRHGRQLNASIRHRELSGRLTVGQSHAPKDDHRIAADEDG